MTIPTIIFASLYPAFISQSDAETISAIGTSLGTVLSLIALLVSLWVAARQQRLSRWQLRLHREDHIIEWSRNCLEILADVEERVESGRVSSGEIFEKEEYIEIRSGLSAMIDEGRLYFPNIQDSKKGADKDLAYRGSRQPVLDTLVAFYDLLKSIDGASNSEKRQADITLLNVLRRKFVSEVQDSIDPRTFNKIRA